MRRIRDRDHFETVPSLVLSRARPEHAAQVVELVDEGFDGYRAWAPAGWRPVVPGEDQVLRMAEKLELPDVWCQLGRIEGQLVGHVSLAPTTRADPDPPAPGTSKLWQLFVRPAWHGCGVAAALLESAVAEAQRRGFHRLSLFTPRDHARARAFYQREGWAQTGRESDGGGLGLPTVEYARSV
ncbi:MAG: GNAT family N-acetyltransferase [Pseudonocardiales bacterium]